MDPLGLMGGSPSLESSRRCPMTGGPGTQPHLSLGYLPRLHEGGRNRDFRGVWKPAKNPAETCV